MSQDQKPKERKNESLKEVLRYVWGWLDNSDLANCRLVSHLWRSSIDETGLDTPSITCTAPVNIAVIKYWGKRDENLILPTNSSLSGTLHQDDLRSKTTVQGFRNLKEDEFYLNGKKETLDSVRIQNCLRLIRSAAGTLDKEKRFIKKEGWRNYKLRIVSENNFPTAAGLASSASGFCCLVYALSRLFCLPQDPVGIKRISQSLSAIARQGSGSACRSMYGGFSKWEKGTNPDGSDSVALPVVSEEHYPEMRVVILVANDQKKAVGSTEGMRFSLLGAAGKKLQERADVTVPKRMKEIEDAIEKKDFDRFAYLTMIDSDDFHEICHITEPPLHYMNDTSRLIVRVVNALNEGGPRKAAYTFDAGPNGVIYLLQENLDTFLRAALYCFPQSDEGKQEPYLRNIALPEEGLPPSLSPETKKELESIRSQVQQTQASLKYILATRIGPGPQLLDQ